MSPKEATLGRVKPTLAPLSIFQRVGRHVLQKSLGRLARGRIDILESGQRHAYGDAATGLQATMEIHDPSFYGALTTRGSVGIGESYSRGEWSSPDLPRLLRTVLQNRGALDGIEGGFARLSAPLLALWHGRRANDKEGSRKNIAAHYDIGNEFFEAFLDSSMTYSCGIFESETSTLLEASVAKLDQACRSLALSPGEHLLEIGTGWGSMSMHAAEHYGCRVTTTTISREQHALALQRVAKAGLSDRIEVLLCDYRELEGEYDKLVSIEMVEAVGHEHLDSFFETCSRRLKPNGLMLLQSIRIADQYHDDQLRAPDFIKRHVFPGSHIPSITTLSASLTRATDMRMLDLLEIGPHYARTLAEWRSNFHGALDAIRGFGYDEELLRGWDYYLAYCEAGFAEGYLGDSQLLLGKPGAQVPPHLSSPR